VPTPEPVTPPLASKQDIPDEQPPSCPLIL
jgi:hypothetical protein